MTITMARALTLPWSVIVPDNQRHGVINGRVLLTAKYRRALRDASALAAVYCKGGPLEGDVHLRVDVFPPDRRRRDLLNCAKLICDALTGVAYRDDSQIARTEWVRQSVDRDNPRVEIWVRGYPGEAA